MTHKLHINAYFIIFFAFFRQAPRGARVFRVFCVVCRLSLSPIQELEPGAMPCRGGRFRCRYPHGLPAA